MELSIQKQELINMYSKMVTEIIYDFLQNKLFQPIGIELSTVPVILETTENHSFKCNSSMNDEDLPLAYYRPDTDSIHVFIEHYSFLNRPNNSEKYTFLMFLLFHEAGHRLFMTMQRQNNRDFELWNIATDLEIHNMYYVYSQIIHSNGGNQGGFLNKCDYIDSFLINKTNKDERLNEGLFEKDYLKYVAEEIYQDLLKSKKVTSNKFIFDKNGNLKDTNNDTNNSGGESITVTTSEYQLPSGKKIKSTTVDCSGLKGKEKTAGEEENDKNNTILRKTILENTIKDEMQKANGRGNISFECKEFLKKMFHIKIDWKKILRNSLQTALEKADYFSWSRPRISMYGMRNAPYLPEQCYDNEKCGVLIVARDESGSMSNTEVAKAAGIIADAKEHYKKIIVIKHDHAISSINEFEELDESARKMLLERCSCGGTSHKEVFEWIRNYFIKNKDTEDAISCVISITDMESDIEIHQNLIPPGVPMIYLAPNGCDKSHTHVKGVIIPVEI